MFVKILDRDKLPITAGVDLAVVNYDAYARYGPHTATIEATGAAAALEALRRWIGYYAIIYNGNNRPVWWGKITGIDAPHGVNTVDVSLADMYNRVQVLYTYQAGDSLAVTGATSWVEHAKSVDTFGRKELRHSLGQASAAQANAAALTILSKSALAPVGLSLSRNEAAVIRCEGLGKLLDWTYYDDPVGFVGYDGVDDIEHPLGWGTTSNQIGFADKAIHKMIGTLGELPANEIINISGSALNNGTRTTAGSNGKPEDYTATTISFAPSDDILDTAKGLGFVRMGSFIMVSGSPGNSGAHLVDGTARDHITTDTGIGGTIDTEGAGVAITIHQSASLDINEDVKAEAPGAFVTLTGTPRLAYSFTPTGVTAWPAHEIWVKARAVGTPGDALRASLYSNNAGAPGVQLDTGTVSGISKSSGWVGVNLTGVATLIPGVTYWIVVERTGAASSENYYMIAAVEKVGSILLWNGAAWVARNASLPYQVWGHTATTEQIRQILTIEGQFLAGVDIRANSGVLRRRFRAGDRDTLSELDDLLDAGMADGSILLARINEDWRCIVEAAPQAIAKYRLLRTGEIANNAGAPIEQGFLPVGEYIAIDGLAGEDDGTIASALFLVGYIEYNVRQGRITDLRPYGSSSIWDLDTILQG